MNSNKSLRSVYTSFLLFAAVTPTSNAGFHLWQLKEVFTNSDGSVQFIEMFDFSNFENLVDGQLIRVTADDEITDFVFPDNIPFDKQTANRHLLIATAGFGALAGGVTPDFTLVPSDPGHTGPFFNPNATSFSITFFGSGDTLSFTGATLPKDGINSLTDTNLSGSLASGINSPTNIDNQSGSVDLSTPSPTGDYDGNHVVDAADYVSWRDRLNQTGLTPGSGPDGSNNGTVDLADYTFWRSKFGNAAPGAGSGVPEPATLCVLGVLSFMMASLRRCG